MKKALYLIPLLSILSLSEMAACHLSEVNFISHTYTGSGQNFEIEICIGGGITGIQKGGGANTKTIGIGFFNGGNTLNLSGFTPSITSLETNVTMNGLLIGPSGAIGSDETLFYQHSPSDDPFVCVNNTPDCGDIHQDCFNISFTTDLVFDSLRVYGAEGNGNPFAGCYPNPDMMIDIWSELPSILEYSGSGNWNDSSKWLAYGSPCGCIPDTGSVVTIQSGSVVDVLDAGVAKTVYLHGNLTVSDSLSVVTDRIEIYSSGGMVNDGVVLCDSALFRMHPSSQFTNNGEFTSHGSPSHGILAGANSLFINSATGTMNVSNCLAGISGPLSNAGTVNIDSVTDGDGLRIFGNITMYGLVNISQTSGAGIHIPANNPILNKGVINIHHTGEQGIYCPEELYYDSQGFPNYYGGVLTNDTTGIISINETTGAGMDMGINRWLYNFGEISINTNIQSRGIISQSRLRNFSTGEITVNDCIENAIYLENGFSGNNGDLDNYGTITLSNSGETGLYLSNLSQGDNFAGATIAISNSADRGMYCNFFANEGLIKIGHAPIGLRTNVFENKPTGVLEIDSCSLAGIDLRLRFENSGQMEIDSCGAGIHFLSNEPVSSQMLTNDSSIVVKNCPVVFKHILDPTPAPIAITNDTTGFFSIIGGEIELLEVMSLTNKGIFNFDGASDSSQAILVKGIFENDTLGTATISNTDSTAIKINGPSASFTNEGHFAITTNIGKYAIEHIEGSFSNTGTMELGGTPGDAFTASGTLVNDGTFRFLDNIGGNMIGDSFTNNGRIEGTGNINSNGFNNNGTIAPGYSPGLITYYSGMDLTNSVLDMEVAGVSGAGQPNGHDALLALDTAVIGGVLNVAVDAGFSPQDNDQFTIIECANGCNGVFTSANLPDSHWSINYFPNAVILKYNTSMSNDDACDAIPLTLGAACSGYPYDNTDATAQMDEPFPDCFFGDTLNLASVWFSFVAPASERVKIRVEAGSGIGSANEQFAVYSVTDCGDFMTFTEVACYANMIEDYLILPDLVAGETYYIQFDGINNDEGTFCIEIEDCPAPANEEVCNATLLTVGETCTGMPYSTSCALPQPDEPFPSCFFCCGVELNTVWFKYTVPASGRVSITMEASNSDENNALQAAIYSATDCNDFSTFAEVTCSNEWPHDSIVVDGAPGETYYIQVDANFTELISAFCISVMECPPPVNDNVCNALPLTINEACTGDPYNNVCALTEPNEPVPSCFATCCGPNYLNTVWFSVVPTSTGLDLDIEVDGGPLNDQIDYAVYSASSCGDFSGFTELACQFGEFTDIELSGLIQGETYYVQVDGSGVYTNVGTFCLEARSLKLNCPPALTVDCSAILPEEHNDFTSFLNAGGSVEANCLTGLDTMSFQYLGIVGDTFACPGMATRRYEVTNKCGDISYCDQTIQIVDQMGCDGTDLVIDETPLPFQQYRAFNSITSGGTVANGSDIEMLGGQFIDLKAGFDVEAGGVLFIDMEGCNQ